MPKQILEINTLIPDRLAINIDGRLYELRDKAEIGIEDLFTLQLLYDEVIQIQNLEAEKITPEVGKELSIAMDKLCRLLLIDCPDAVHSKLQDYHRMAIFKVFQQAAGEETQPPNRKTRRTKKLT